MTRIFIVDDHVLIREGLKKILDTESDLTIVGEAQNGSEVLDRLDKCKCDLDIRGIHNENLNSDLIQHRKFMDVLGSANTIKYSDNQLSGLGFNATVKDELIVKLSGSFKRVVKIKF